MKKIFTIAAALVCSIMANAQTLTFKHDGNVIPNGGEIVVSTYDETMMEVGILQFTPHIKLNGTEAASKDNPVPVQVEHLDGETLELCAFGACLPYKQVVSATATTADMGTGLPANTDTDIQLHSSWIMDKTIATSKCKVSAWYGDDASKAISFILYMSNDPEVVAGIDHVTADGTIALNGRTLNYSFPTAAAHTFEMYTMDGKKANSVVLNGNGAVSLDGLAKGMYIYTIKNGKETVSGKVVLK